MDIAENVLGIPAVPVPPPNAGASAGEERIVWRGNIRIQWDVNEVVIPSMAINLHVPAFTPLLDASFWPTDIICDTSQLTEIHSFFSSMTEGSTQWLVKFVPLPCNNINTNSANTCSSSTATAAAANTANNNNSINTTALSHLAKTMALRGYAAYIPIPDGTIYLWSTSSLGLIAVYKPNPCSSSSHISLTPFDVGMCGIIPNGGSTYYSTSSGGHYNNTSNYYGPFITTTTRPSASSGISNINGIWTGFLQVRLRERAENLYVSACQSNISRDFGVLDASNWPFNLWCAPSNMLISSPLLAQMHENTTQWIVRFVAATPSDNHTQNALRSLAVYMQARRLMFEISCGTLNGDELMLCLFGVVHSSYGNCIVAGFRVASAPDHAYDGAPNPHSKNRKKNNNNITPKSSILNALP